MKSPALREYLKEELTMLKTVLKKFEDMNDTVTEDMLVGDIVRLHPEVIDTLLSQGMHCLGCPSSQQESLANACMVHGLDPAKITTAVNVAIQANKQ
jgi:hybrid cluster-associated redox disulfide protein